MLKRCPFICLVLSTAACDSFRGSAGNASSQAVGDIPESVAALAAPYQDVATARLVADDSCFWYLHDGPVETTLLPLRTIEGRQICVQRDA